MPFGPTTTDPGLAAYMRQVYIYMAKGLALTGAVAYGTFYLAWDANAGYLTDFGATLLNGPVILVLGLVTLAVFFLFLTALSAWPLWAGEALFWLFSAVQGLMLSAIFIEYTGESIGEVFLITAAIFVAMSFWGFITQTDLTSLGSVLFLGMVGLLIAMLMNFFLQSPMLTWLLSLAAVVIFTLAIAFDTQRIRNSYYDPRFTSLEKRALLGASALYLNVLNLFLNLLRLLGERRQQR